LYLLLESLALFGEFLNKQVDSRIQKCASQHSSGRSLPIEGYSHQARLPKSFDYLYGAGTCLSGFQFRNLRRHFLNKTSQPSHNVNFTSVFRIRRIRGFYGLLDPDPKIFNTDPALDPGLIC
jgi:hypothetical protein